MKIIEGEKFVSLEEIASFLNEKQPDKKLHYTVSELACAWADTRAKFYQENGHQVKEGKHYVPGDTEAEHLLSRSACELIEKFAAVDGHHVPLLGDGIAGIFTM